MSETEETIEDPQIEESGESQEEESPEQGEDAAPEPAEAQPQESETQDTVSAEEYRKLQARLAYEQRQNKRIQQQEQPRPQQATEQPGKPKIDDFDDYEDYLDARDDWNYRHREQEKTKQQQQQRLSEIVSEQVAKDPDFLNKALIPPELLDLVADSEQVVDIALHFGSNPAEVLRLVDMPPTQAAREIGKLEVKLANQPPPQRTETRAPSPTKPVGGSEHASKDPANMSYAEYKAWRMRGA